MKRTVLALGSTGIKSLPYIYKNIKEPIRMIAMDCDEGELERAQADETLLYVVSKYSELPHLKIKGDPSDISGAMQDNLPHILKALEKDTHVIIVGGLAGGFTFAVMPALASALTQMGKDVHCIGIMPFNFELQDRAKRAQDANKAVLETGVRFTVLSNQDLFTHTTEQTSFSQAFEIMNGWILAAIEDQMILDAA